MTDIRGIDDTRVGDTAVLADGNMFDIDGYDDTTEHRTLHATYHGQDLWIDIGMFDHAIPAGHDMSIPWPPGLYNDRYLNLWLIDAATATLIRQAGRYGRHGTTRLDSRHATARWLRDYGPFTPNNGHDQPTGL